KAATKAGENELRAVASELQETLVQFAVDAQVVGWTAGPTVTLFKLALGEGVRVARITSLADDIALALAASSVRIFSPIPGTSLVGVEVPNAQRSDVLLGDVLPAAPTGPLQLAIGKDVEGTAVTANLASMPHLLIGGTTGSGKSVAINSMIMSVLLRATPAEVRMILIDPKMVELTRYNDIPHLYVPVVTDAGKAAAALAWSVIEMERRLKLFMSVGVKNIANYNDYVGHLRRQTEREAERLRARAAQAAAKKAAESDFAADAQELADFERWVNGESANSPAESPQPFAPAADSRGEDPVFSSSSNAAVPGSGQPAAPGFGRPAAAAVPVFSTSSNAAALGNAAASGSAVAQEAAADKAAEAEEQIAELFADLPDELPLVMIVIDELADLMMVAGKDVEASVTRLSQLARAAGLHLIIATQRPSTNVITGVIKANIVNRIAFNVGSGIDSRVILDTNGAEALLGNGDCLFSKPEYGKPVRIQGCFVSDGEISQVVSFLKAQGNPDYHEEILATAVNGISVSQLGAGNGPEGDDPLVWEAAEIVVSTQMGSTSTLQRRLKVGYARAGRIMDNLEQKGIVGPANGSRPREVFVDDLLELEGIKALDHEDGGEVW
ncbi:MAG: FtsK/SpoIIIE domain-containing protein, partial [Coriobacteriia bacterium]|nr:FtsK/SpoIIIE domain-containing protein [Coriobacteriia bacterium]